MIFLLRFLLLFSEISAFLDFYDKYFQNFIHFIMYLFYVCILFYSLQFVYVHTKYFNDIRC